MYPIVMWGTTGAHRHRTGGGSFQSESPRKIADQTRSKSHMEMRSRRDFSEVRSSSPLRYSYLFPFLLLLLLFYLSLFLSLNAEEGGVMSD